MDYLEYNRLQEVKSLNAFLYKFLFLNLIINLTLYFLPSIDMAFVIYCVSIFFFFIFYFKEFKHFHSILFLQIYVMFVTNLTYLGYIATYLVNKFYFDINLEDLFTLYFYCDAETYFLANLYLFLFSFFLLVTNNLLPKSLILDSIKKINLKKINIDKKKLTQIIILCLFVELFLYAFGFLGSQTSGGFILDTETSPDDKATWWTQIYYYILVFHILINILYLKVYENISLKFLQIIFISISIILNFIFFGYFERRSILIFFILFFFLYYIFTTKKQNYLKMILVLIVSLFLALQSFILLNTIRGLALFESNTTLVDIINSGEVTSVFSDQEINAFGKEQIIENFQTRIFSNFELATLFYYNQGNINNVLYGEFLFNHFLEIIPQLFYSSKFKNLKGEDLIKTITESPLYLNDTIISLHATSYVDFGIFGLILYPILINLWAFFIYRIIILRWLSPFSAVYIIAIVLPYLTVRTIEVNPTEWFLVVRNIVIFILAFNYLLKFIEKKEVSKS